MGRFIDLGQNCLLRDFLVGPGENVNSKENEKHNKDARFLKLF